MKFLDEFLKEFVNGGKVDIASKVLNCKAQKESKLSRVKDNDLTLNIQAFLADALVLFTDFDETNDEFTKEAEDILKNEYLEPN